MFFRIFTWVSVFVWLICGFVSIDARMRGNTAMAHFLMIFLVIIPLAWFIFFGTRNNKKEEAFSPWHLDLDRPYEIIGSGGGCASCHPCRCRLLKPLVGSDEDYNPRKHAATKLVRFDTEPPMCKYVVPKLTGGPGSRVVFYPFPDEQVHVTASGYKTVIKTVNESQVA